MKNSLFSIIVVAVFLASCATQSTAPANGAYLEPVRPTSAKEIGVGTLLNKSLEPISQSFREAIPDKVIIRSSSTAGEMQTIYLDPLAELFSAFAKENPQWTRHVSDAYIVYQVIVNNGKIDSFRIRLVREFLPN